MGPFDPPASGSLETEWGNGPADNPYRVNVSLTSTAIRNLSMNLSFNTADGNVYNHLTGLDNNNDGLLIDRPAGVGIWMLRGEPVATWSARFSYNIPIMSAPQQPGPPQRYRASVFVSINNLMCVAVFWLNRLMTFSSNRTRRLPIMLTSCETSRSVRVSAGVRPMSPRPLTKTGMVLVVFTTVLMGVPLPAYTNPPTCVPNGSL